MIRQIAPLFFTMDIPGTLAYYKDKLGFECLGTWQDPPVYAIVARDQHAIHFRCAEPPTANPNKYSDELLDAYVFIEDADALYSFQQGTWNSPHLRVPGSCRAEFCQCFMSVPEMPRPSH